MSSSVTAARPKRGPQTGPFGFVTHGEDRAFSDLSVADTLTVGAQATIPTLLVRNVVSADDFDVGANGNILLASGGNFGLAVAGNLDSTVDGVGGATLLASRGPLTFASAVGILSLEGGGGANLVSAAGAVSISAEQTLLAFGRNGVAVESDVAVGISAPDIVLNGNVILDNVNVCGISCPTGNFQVNANLATFDGDVAVQGLLRVCDLECTGTLTLNATDMTVPNDASIGGNLSVDRIRPTSSGPITIASPLGVNTTASLTVGTTLSVSTLNAFPGSSNVQLQSDLEAIGGNLNVASGRYLSTPTIRSPVANLQVLASNLVANAAVTVGTTLRTPSIDGIGGNLTVNAATTVNGSLQIVGSFVVNGALDANGVNCNVGTLVLSAPNGNVEISSPNAVVDGNLFVQGATHANGGLFSSALTVANVGDDLALTAYANVVVAPGNLAVTSGSLVVGGDSTLNGNVAVDGAGGLTVANDLVVSGDANVVGNLDACRLLCSGTPYLAYANGNLAANGNLLLQGPGNATVQGDATVNGVLSVATIARNGVSLVLGVGGNASVATGNLNVASGNLAVSGAATVTGNLTVNNVVAFANSNLRLVSSNVTTAANLAVGSRLTVSGDANVAGNVVVGGALVVNGAFSVGTLQAQNVVSNVGPLRLVATAAGANVELDPGAGGNAVVATGNLVVSTGGATIAGNLTVSNVAAPGAADLRLVSPNVHVVGNAAVDLNLNVLGQGVFGANVATPRLQGPAGGGNLTVVAPAGNLLLSASANIVANADALFVGNLSVASVLSTDFVQPYSAGTLTLQANTVSVPFNLVPNFSTADPTQDRVVFYRSTPGRFVDGGPYGAEFLDASQLTVLGPAFKTAANPLPPAGPGFYGNYANVVSQFTPLNLSTFSSSVGSVSTYAPSTGVLTIASPVGTFYSGAASAMLDSTLLAGEAFQIGMLLSVDSGTTWTPHSFANSVGSTAGGANPVGPSVSLSVAFATSVSPQLALFVVRIVDSAGAPIQNVTGQYYGLRFSLKALA